LFKHDENWRRPISRENLTNAVIGILETAQNNDGKEPHVAKSKIEVVQGEPLTTHMVSADAAISKAFCTIFVTPHA
jgi:hypothetical protein